MATDALPGAWQEAIEVAIEEAAVEAVQEEESAPSNELAPTIASPNDQRWQCIIWDWHLAHVHSPVVFFAVGLALMFNLMFDLLFRVTNYSHGVEASEICAPGLLWLSIITVLTANSKYLTCTTRVHCACVSIGTLMMILAALTSTLRLVFMLVYSDQCSASRGDVGLQIVELIVASLLVVAVYHLALARVAPSSMLSRWPKLAAAVQISPSGVKLNGVRATLRHVLTSRVYGALLLGIVIDLILGIQGILFFVSLRDGLEDARDTQEVDPAAHDSLVGGCLFGIAALAIQMPICVAASAAHGAAHLRRWRMLTGWSCESSVDPVTGNPNGSHALAEDGEDDEDETARENMALLRVGATPRSMINAARFPGLMLGSLLLGTSLIASSIAAVLVFLYMVLTHAPLKRLTFRFTQSILASTCAFAVGLVTRRVLIRCLIEKHHATEDQVPRVKRPCLFAWYELYQLPLSFFEGCTVAWIRLMKGCCMTSVGLLRFDHPAHAEHATSPAVAQALSKLHSRHALFDQVYRAYAGVVVLEQQAELRRQEREQNDATAGSRTTSEATLTWRDTLPWVALWCCCFTTAPTAVLLIIAPLFTPPPLTPPAPPPPPPPPFPSPPSPSHPPPPASPETHGSIGVAIAVVLAVALVAGGGALVVVWVFKYWRPTTEQAASTSTRRRGELMHEVTAALPDASAVAFEHHEV